MTDRIVVTRTPPGRALEILRATGEVWCWTEDRPIPHEILIEQLADADAIYCMLTDRLDSATLEAAVRLRAIAQMAVGVDNIDLKACARRRIPVANTPDVLTDTTADLAFALMMAAARRLTEGVDFIKEGRWRHWEPSALLGRDIHHSTLGIVGFGRIGRAVAQRASGFSMRVIHASPPRPDRESQAEACSVPWSELLTNSDHIVLTCRLTPNTYRLIDADALRAMKDSATLVNVSRGQVVDTEALVEALGGQWIRAAGLDVTDPEPLPREHPLIGMENCIVVPHVGSATEATRAAMAELAADNLVLALEGKPMRTPIGL